MRYYNDSHNIYVLETRRLFSKIIREVFGEEEKSFTISDPDKIDKVLIQISEKINLQKKKMSYIWWWRSGNNHLERFETREGYLYLNYWKLRIKELYINISPISIFDFIIFRVIGEVNEIPDTKNYEWNNGEFTDLDLKRHTFFDFNIRKSLGNELECFNEPFNFILTAQFGLPNLNIYTESTFEIMLNKLLFEEIDYEYFKNWYTKVLVEVKKYVNRLYEKIIKYPMLALDDKLGKYIYENLKRLGRFQVRDQIFYIARQLNSNIPFDEPNMWHPPSNRVAVYEGRYNHFGQSFLYLANNEETAFMEVIPEWHKSCSMIQIKINKTIDVLDLRRVNFYVEENGLDYILLHYMLVHEGTISREAKNPYIKPEYLVPRFVADCARHYNFDGILFNSTKNNGDNLVLFEPDTLREEGKVITSKIPYIYEIT